ncbi:hypothetical protein [Acinetobacter baumannii]|uniref:hypothetical protein n=1 Tax=Acinetobacter baumannii TaxID=470 RepID=UPI000DFCC85E|nr:hypothetical protein [Acinetobacter baumannii]RCT89698.1 hypothetical protein DVA68_16000 [Acinetobacter baumannii]
MNTITEAVLIDNARNGAVEVVKIAPSPDNKGFFVYVVLTWKPDEMILVTHRKQPRLWASLDRLYAHISSKYGKISSINVFFSKHKQED